MNLIKQLFSNTIVFYLTSRYITYFIQFILSIIIAVKLGPYYLGIWGFLLLLLSYFGQIDFGIANSLNVLLVQNKANKDQCNSYLYNSFIITGILSILVILVAAYYHVFGFHYFDKYNIGALFYLICIVAILQYFNNLFVTVYRVYNSLIEIIINQSLIVFLSFIIVFFLKEELLINALVFIYILINVLSLVLFVKNNPLSFKHQHFSLLLSKQIVKKGIFLFIYNCSFYFIITSERTLISYYYSIEDFGQFSFAYTLANSLMLLLNAFTFIIFPKVIHKFASENKIDILKSMDYIMINFVTLSHFLVYCAMIGFPLMLLFFPEYSKVSQMLNLIALSTLLSSNSFGYITYLIAQNKEKLAAKLSAYALVFNILIAIILIKVLHVQVQYVIFSTLIAYLFFSFFATLYSKIILDENNSLLSTWNSFFPLRLFIPFIVALGTAIIDNPVVNGIPLLLFLLLNYKTINEIIITTVHIIKNPKIINV